jgi:hypothetical protein
MRYRDPMTEAVVSLGIGALVIARAIHILK